MRGLLGLTGPDGWPAWEPLVHEPTALSLAQLQAAARLLGVRVGGTKPELIVRLLGAMGLALCHPLEGDCSCGDSRSS